MIEMADDQIFIAKIDKRMKQRDGIATSGDADEVATRWRKVAPKSRAVD